MLNRFEQFSTVVSGINRYIQKIERDEMVKYGYKGAFAQYLVVLNKYPQGLTLTNLCEICDKDKAAVSRALTELVEKELVFKDIKENKSYKGKYCLTYKGKECAEYVVTKAKMAVSKVGSELSEEQRAVLYSSLEIIAENLKKISKDGLN